MALWIAGITRGHNGGVCLLKDGEIVFAIEEERLSRVKYDGGPYAAMIKILEYTDHLDYLVIAHTQSLQETAGKVDFTGDDVYTGLARKLGLIDRKSNIYNHPQVIDVSYKHHELHAACAFYRSGFSEALAVIVDGAGTFIPWVHQNEATTVWELESAYQCTYPVNFSPVYKRLSGRGPMASAYYPEFYDQNLNATYELIVDDSAGITKAYEAVTQYCGWSPIEAGKTMGLFPYGNPNNNIPPVYVNDGSWTSANRHLIIPTYPNGAEVNEYRYSELATPANTLNNELTYLQNRRDLAYAVQTQSQAVTLELIKKVVAKTGVKKVVLSGGYALNCVANYWYLDKLKEEGIDFYVEPISSDAGTAIGAALLHYHNVTQSTEVNPRAESLYLGPKYNYSIDTIIDTAKKYQAEVIDADNKTVIRLLKDKHIVSLFQGRCENGPRALGNRSILFDPTFKDGKDWVNRIKHREYFRPFAGSILHEHAHEWFDMRGLEESPHMMYAMNCQPGIAGKIPSIIHIDGTCRIQTVKQQQNPLYYELINDFYKDTGVPILFNTSFNLGGEPLVETLDDAIRTLANSEIEYLYLPEYSKLVMLKNK